MKILIAGSGPRAGKDTVAAMLSEILEIPIVAQADPIKRLAKELYPEIMKKPKEEHRVFLRFLGQYLGDEPCKGVMPELPITIMQKIKDSFTPSKDFWTSKAFNKGNQIVSDFRMKKEYLHATLLGDVVTVLVNRDGVEKIACKTEQDLIDFKFDFTVENDGTLVELSNKLSLIADEILYLIYNK